VSILHPKKNDSITRPVFNIFLILYFYLHTGRKRREGERAAAQMTIEEKERERSTAAQKLERREGEHLHKVPGKRRREEDSC